MTESPYTPEELNAAWTALRVLDVFRAVDPEMPIGEAVSLLIVGKSDGISLTGLKKEGGFALSSASRYAQILGFKGGRGRKPGKELITSRQNRLDDRRKVLELSPKGVALVAQLRQVLRGSRAR